MWSNKGGSALACCLVFSYAYVTAQGKLDSEDDGRDSADRDLDEMDTNVTNIIQANISADNDVDDSGEHIGPMVSQIHHHPYAASLQKNNTYVCSAIILNSYWSITLSKCFDSKIISSYVTHKYLGNYTLRVGSSYNNKSGSTHKIKSLINNFDLKVSAVKLVVPLEYSSRVRPVNIPKPEDDVSLGYLASILAWTPNGHMRVLNAPVVDSSICEPATKLLPGHYICVGGVQDPNRNFCRKDDGGAVIQNNMLIGIAAFLHTCAVYTRTHAFPKVSSFARWLDSVIWDEDNRPTTFIPSTTPGNTAAIPVNITDNSRENQNMYADPRKQLFPIPFAPISVPLEPAENNSVLPRMSLYESYLQSIARSKTSTTQDPNIVENVKREWLRKFGKKYNMLPEAYEDNKYRRYG